MSGDTPVDGHGLTAEHDVFRTRVRVCLDRVVLPDADAWEAQAHIAAEGWRALGDLGLFSLGHSGADFLHSAIFLEELGATGYAGIRAAVGVHAYMAASYLELFGTERQRDAYLAPARQGELIAALAISEADAGSDLRHLRTRAECRSDGSYLVNGEKSFVANGSQAGFLITLVRTRDAPTNRGLAGASLVIIDADSPGVHREPQPMLGWRSADICRISLRDVIVPAAWLIGRPNQALTQLMRALDFERLVAGLLAVGGTRHCLALVDRFVREHQVWDAPLSTNQAVRHRIAELTSDFELVRQYAYYAAGLHGRGAMSTQVASILKLKATELAVAAAQMCIQYHGARGCLDDATAARLYRDAVGGTIAAGASELLRDMIFELSAITSGHGISR